MATRHLSLAVTAYKDGSWGLSVIETTCPPGRPASHEQRHTRWSTMEQLLDDGQLALLWIVNEASRDLYETQDQARRESD